MKVLAQKYIYWPKIIDIVIELVTAFYKACQKNKANKVIQWTVMRKSDEFRSFLRNNGIKHLTSAPYFPQAQGEVEGYVATIKTSLQVLAEGNDNLEI